MTVGRHRSPVVVVILSIITFGIYYLYWYYSVNSEMRRYRPSIEVSPGIALLSQFVPIANWISAYNTAGRLLTLEEAEPVPHGISPGIALLLHILLGIAYPFYVQDHLNRLWEAAGHRGALGPQTRGFLPDDLNRPSGERPTDQAAT